MSQSADYKKLKKLWYEKLKNQGFKDIEGDDGKLESWSSKATKISWRRDEDGNKHLVQDRENYYRLAGHFLNDFKFSSRLDRIVWEYHSNGLSLREITSLLKTANIVKTNRQTIWQTIKRLEMDMKKLYQVSTQDSND